MHYLLDSFFSVLHVFPGSRYEIMTIFSNISLYWMSLNVFYLELNLISAITPLQLETKLVPNERCEIPPCC